MHYYLQIYFDVSRLTDTRNQAAVTNAIESWNFEEGPENISSTFKGAEECLSDHS